MAGWTPCREQSTVCILGVGSMVEARNELES